MTGTQKEPWARGLCEAPRDHTSLVLLDFIWAQGLRESPPGTCTSLVMSRLA